MSCKFKCSGLVLVERGRSRRHAGSRNGRLGQNWDARMGPMGPDLEQKLQILSPHSTSMKSDLAAPIAMSYPKYDHTTNFLSTKATEMNGKRLRQDMEQGLLQRGRDWGFQFTI